MDVGSDKHVSVYYNDINCGSNIGQKVPRLVLNSVLNLIISCRRNLQEIKNINFCLY